MRAGIMHLQLDSVFIIWVAVRVPLFRYTSVWLSHSLCGGDVIMCTIRFAVISLKK